MPLKDTLLKVDAEVEDGDFGQARDRLLGLVGTYPSRLELRRQLAGVYWSLGDRAMAGRYWYLEDEGPPEKETAVAAFERHCGGHPGRIARALKLRVAPDELPTEFARRRIETLVERARHRGEHLRFTQAGVRGRPGFESSPAGVRVQVIQYGCMLAVAAVATLAIIGLLSVIETLF